MNGGISQDSRVMESVLRDLDQRPQFSCMLCGSKFWTRAAKRSHRPVCKSRRSEVAKIADAEWAELDGRPMERIVQTELAAKRADPEWLAMVERDWGTGGEVT